MFSWGVQIGVGGIRIRIIRIPCRRCIRRGRPTKIRKGPPFIDVFVALAAQVLGAGAVQAGSAELRAVHYVVLVEGLLDRALAVADTAGVRLHAGQGADELATLPVEDWESVALRQTLDSDVRGRED